MKHFGVSRYGEWHTRPEGSPWRLRDKIARFVDYHCWDCWWRVRSQEKRDRVYATLTTAGPEGMYGLDLMHTAGLSPGLLYPELRQLEAEGLVRSWWAPAVAAQPRRRMYASTYWLSLRMPEDDR